MTNSILKLTSRAISKTSITITTAVNEMRLEAGDATYILAVLESV